MIKIKVTSNEKAKILTITVKGHSYKKNNKDIDPLCATVSAVVLGTLNALKTLFPSKKEIIIEKKPGHIVFINKSTTKEINAILQTMSIQLKTIYLYFKAGILIQEQIEKN